MPRDRMERDHKKISWNENYKQTVAQNGKGMV